MTDTYEDNVNLDSYRAEIDRLNAKIRAIETGALTALDTYALAAELTKRGFLKVEMLPEAAGVRT